MTVTLELPSSEAAGDWCAHAAMQAGLWAIFLTILLYLCLAVILWLAAGLVWLGKLPGRYRRGCPCHT